MAKALIIQPLEPGAEQAAQLQAEGYPSCHCKDVDAACAALAADPEFQVAILDADLPAEALARGVRELRALQPGIHLVGQGPGATAALFGAIGIRQVLQSGWEAADLFVMLGEDPAASDGESWVGDVAARIDSVDARLEAMQESLQVLGSRRPAELVLEALGSLAGPSDEGLGFLRGTEMFGVLSDDALRVVAMLGQRRVYDRGTRLFGVGDCCDTLFVVQRGTLEIRRRPAAAEEVRTTAFLGPGEVLCEMGILPGTAHESEALAVDEAEVLSFRREVFTGLLTMFPQLAVHMYAVMARRLEQLVQTSGVDQARNHKLQGCLEHFDLASILQSLMLAEERSGVLSIWDAQGQPVARIKLGGGSFRYAEMGRLRGRDAIYQLFQAEFAGHSFEFRERVEEDSEQMPLDEELAAMQGTTLLLDAARLTDESGRVKQDLFQDPTQVYTHGSASLEWLDGLTARAAEQIWELTAGGASLEELLAAEQMSQAQLYCVLAEMLRLGLLAGDGVAPQASRASPDSWLID